MRARAIEVRNAVGRSLYATIFGRNGKKLFPRGHVISEAEAKLLDAEGCAEVWVADLEEDEVNEDEAAMRVARAIMSGAMEARIAAGGRTNLFSADACCVLVDNELLKDLNQSSSIAVATVWNWSYVSAGKRVATVKSAPFSVPKQQLDAVTEVVRQRGPVLRAAPIRSPAVGVIYSDPENGERARVLFEKIMYQRLQRFGARVSVALSALEQEDTIAGALGQVLRTRPACVLIASTIAPAGPQDVVGRAMIRAGCRIERFLAPVEPGNLLLLGYQEDTAVVAAPGCFRSSKPTVVDLILPPLLARHRISGMEIASLGPVGLLTEQ